MVIRPTATPAGPQEHPLDTLEPGCWYASKSTLREVLPPDKPYGDVGPSAIMSASSGAAYDTTRNRLLVTGGGWQDYAGNELYAFDVQTMTWGRIWGPTPNAAICPPPDGPGGESYADGNPRARHTYGGLQYIPGLDSLWMFGGKTWSKNGDMSKQSWLFDFAENRWIWKAPCPYPNGAVPYTAYDAADGVVYCHAFARLYTYAPIENRWSVIGTYPPGANPACGALVWHSKDQALYLIGAARIYRYDLSEERKPARLTWKTDDLTQYAGGSGYPAIAYDTKRGEILAFDGGTSLYALDISTYLWTERPASGENVVAPDRLQPSGTFGRFCYIEKYDVVMLVNSIGSPAYFYKLGTH